ncbi:phosphatidylinositol/phosphatidylcholine transfer protein SFH3 [Mercurialis annua]|uniref:phosphatidylinositol/phosphatidylcholine transfer protein SFH3 n=1 Tax=Mercurialis annua TaxID=3986 RepID=UPI00215FED9E|nr:phosphatidylinositol/phosphatidylcholine transfer protein SFH3 [Mercurialis annua]
MVVVPDEAVDQFKALMDQVEDPFKKTYKNIHQGYQTETSMRFLKAREWNVTKAHKMLVDCLHWRIQNEIDNILTRPIIPTDLYRAVRDSQLIGMSGYSREGLPVFAIGVGLSTYDKASVNYYVQSHIQMNEYRDRVILPSASEKHKQPITTCIKVLDMSGLKLSALSQIKLLTIISTIDDLNYPEKTKTYYIVNAPYIFSACWKAVKPLLQERTRKKIQVLSGNGQDELLKIMDLESLPHFCKREGPGSSRRSGDAAENCFSLDHHFHQKLYDYIKQQSLVKQPAQPIKQGSFHVNLPEAAAEGTEIGKAIESELHKIGNCSEQSSSVHKLRISGD